MSDNKKMTVEQAVEIVGAVEWSGDLRVIATRLSNAGRVLAKRIAELEAALREYADHNNWTVAYGDYLDRRLWKDSGDGWEIAAKAMRGEA